MTGMKSLSIGFFISYSMPSNLFFCKRIFLVFLNLTYYSCACFYIFIFSIMDFSSHEIAGVGLEQYAKLCALMANTQPEETDKHAEIAQANGVSKENWEEAKKGWTEMMMD